MEREVVHVFPERLEGVSASKLHDGDWEVLALVKPHHQDLAWLYPKTFVLNGTYALKDRYRHNAFLLKKQSDPIRWSGWTGPQLVERMRLNHVIRPSFLEPVFRFWGRIMKGKTLFLKMILLGGMLGCMSMARGMGVLVPGYGVSPETAESICPSLAHFDARVAFYRGLHYEARDNGTGPIRLSPSVGMDHCEVLAMLGAPDDVTRIQTMESYSLSLTYFTGSTVARDLSAHLLSLDRDPQTGRMIVTSVVW